MITIYQYKNGYRYNSDTIFLYNFISRYKIRGDILDVGSGCGILGLLIKRDFPDITLTQIDIQQKNIDLTIKNSQINNLENFTVCGDFLETEFQHKFNFILSNPPFYNQGALKSENESLYLSRHSAVLPFYDFAKKVYKILKPKGSFIFCYDAKQIDKVMSTLLELKFKVNDIQFVHPKITKDASLVLIHAKRESKSLCKILNPLIVFEDGEYKDEIKDIFKKADTNSVDY